MVSHWSKETEQLLTLPLDTGAQAFLTQFISSNDSLSVQVRGDSESSPFSSLGPALEGLNLKASIPGLGIQLITSVTVYVTYSSLDDNFVTLQFTVRCSQKPSPY